MLPLLHYGQTIIPAGAALSFLPGQQLKREGSKERQTMIPEGDNYRSRHSYFLEAPEKTVDRPSTGGPVFSDGLFLVLQRAASTTEAIDKRAKRLCSGYLKELGNPSLLNLDRPRHFPPANLTPISNAFWQSTGNTSSCLCFFFTGSKRVASTLE